jgi:D-sedoheptulose 7-phosphate isomerase
MTQGTDTSSFAARFVREAIELLAALDAEVVERVATGLAGVRADQGRLFILGVGGSAGHAGHAVNDFRKLCGFEAYAPTDNVSELTARTNDEGWDSTFVEWLRGSRLREDEAEAPAAVAGNPRGSAPA